MRRAYIPHSVRHGYQARRALTASPLGGRQQRHGERGNCPSTRSPVAALALYLAYGLAVMALVGAAALGWAVVLP